MSEYSFWLEEGEVIQRKNNGDLWHVSRRLFDVDSGDRMYHVWDDTHTSDDYWHEDDARDVFERTDVIVQHSKKPKHVIDGRLYERVPDHE